MILEKKLNVWNKYFAWKPVKIEGQREIKWIWLNWVERKRKGSIFDIVRGFHYIYREIENNARNNT